MARTGNSQAAWRNAPWLVMAVAAFVALASNVDLAPDLQWHDGQRLGQLVLLIVVLMLLPFNLRGMAGVWSGLQPWIRHAWLAAFTLGLVSSLSAALPRWALLEWGQFLLLWLIVLGVAAQRRQSGVCLDQPLILLMFATALAYAISACVVYVTMLLIGPAYGQVFNIRELYVNFSNVRFFGHIQTMMLPFLLLPAMWWGTTPWKRIALWVVPAVWWMLAISSGTRGTWIALLVGAAAVALYGRSAGRRWIKWQCGGLLAGFACYVLFIMLIPGWLEQAVWSLPRAGEIMALSFRDVLWGDAVHLAMQHPLLGIGPMHYAYFSTALGAHPHNAVLQWLVEWGMAAALLLTGVCAVAGLAYAAYVRRTVDTAPSRMALLQVALLAALAGAAAQALVDGVLIMPVSQTLLVLLCGWAMGIYLPVAVMHSGVARRALLMMVAAVAACVVAYGVSPEIGRLAERERKYLADNPPGTVLLPRFWTQGLIGR